MEKTAGDSGRQLSTRSGSSFIAASFQKALLSTSIISNMDILVPNYLVCKSQGERKYWQVGAAMFCGLRRCESTVDRAARHPEHTLAKRGRPRLESLVLAPLAHLPHRG